MDLELLKKRKKELKMTFEELSELSGVSISSLKGIFGGVTPNPRIDTMQAIERALGLNDNLEDVPDEISKLIAISQLTPEEYKDVLRYIDFVIAKRKKWKVIFW